MKRGKILFAIPALAAALAIPAAAAPGKRGDGKGQFAKELKELDTNSDKRISKDEWKGDAEVFAKRDLNKDGYLDRADAKAAREQAFTKMDANNDGRIARDEWTQKAKAFDRMDANRDGFLAKDEMGRRKK